MWCLIFACNILPLLLPDDALQTCRVHLQKNVSVLDCVTPSTEEGLSHSKLAAGITKTKPRHLPALLRRCFGFPVDPPQHVWLRPADIWRPQAGGCVTLPRYCLFLFDSLHLYKISKTFLASHQPLIWSGDFPACDMVHIPSLDTAKQYLQEMTYPWLAWMLGQMWPQAAPKSLCFYCTLAEAMLPAQLASFSLPPSYVGWEWAGEWAPHKITLVCHYKHQKDLNC